MSFGDPNNPYGQQQGGQPGYGQPQQGQAPGQPGYGYPQAPPVQAYDGGYGYGNTPVKMPGTLSAARIMLYVIAGFQVIGAGLLFLTGAAVTAAKDDPSLQGDVQFQDLADFGSSAVYGIGFAALLWGAFAIFLAVKFAKGGTGIRITTLVFAVITALLGIYPFIVVGLAHTVLAILIAVFVGKSDGGAWFSRPRH